MKLNEDKVPANLEEALLLLKEAITPLELAEIKKSTSVELHPSLGRIVRNEWSLHEGGNIISVWFFKTYGISHADDISGIILECLINDLMGVPRRDKEVAEKCIKYWKNNK